MRARAWALLAVLGVAAPALGAGDVRVQIESPAPGQTLRDSVHQARIIGSATAVV